MRKPPYTSRGKVREFVSTFGVGHGRLRNSVTGQHQFDTTEGLFVGITNSVAIRVDEQRAGDATWLEGEDIDGNLSRRGTHAITNRILEGLS